MLLVLAGRTASGKSSLASAVGERLGFRVAGFGQYVRSLVPEASAGEAARSQLQAKGHATVQRNPATFASEFLKWAGYNAGEGLIADGLRHIAIWDVLKNILIPQKDPIGLVFVAIGDAVRVNRLRARGLSDADIAAIEQHPSERDVLFGLQALAGLSVDGASSVEDNAERVLSTFDWLRPSDSKGAL